MRVSRLTAAPVQGAPPPPLAPPAASPGRASLLAQLADLPGLLAFGALALLLAQTVAGRLSYPFDLEWMEGGMLMHALRVSQGLPLYTEPSADWIPYLYPPLYPWLLAAISPLVGVGYTAGRLVSVLGVVAACVALVQAVRKEGGSLLLGLGAVALFLSCYEDSGTFYDLVRADGLLVGLLSWSLVSVRRDRPVLGGGLLVLAFLAKHNAAAFGLPMLIWLWRARGRGPALRFVLASLVPALLVTAGLELSTHGLFLTYLLDVPSHHGFVLDRFFPGAPRELWAALPAGVVVAGLGLLSPLVGRLQGRGGALSVSAREGAGFWVPVILLAILLCMVMRGHQGGFLNVLVPGHWALALAAALGAVALRRALPHPVTIALTALVLAGQAWLGHWALAPTQPTAADLAAGQALIARIQAIDGPVLMPHSPWYPVLAGKQGSFPLIALWDVDHPGRLRSDVARVDQAIAEHRWAAIILADDKLGHGLLQSYELSDTIRYTGGALYPKTGWHVRPRLVYTPRP